MKKTRKFLLTILSILAITTGTLGVVACGSSGGHSSSSSSTQTENNAFRQVYAMYVENAKAQGKTPAPTGIFSLQHPLP